MVWSNSLTRFFYLLETGACAARNEKKYMTYHLNTQEVPYEYYMVLLFSNTHKLDSWSMALGWFLLNRDHSHVEEEGPQHPPALAQGSPE